jgi:hypothetical protein
MYNPACPQLNRKRNPIVMVSRGSRMWCGLRSVYSVLPVFLVMPLFTPTPFPKDAVAEKIPTQNNRPSHKYPSARVEMKIQKITQRGGKVTFAGPGKQKSIFEMQCVCV